MIKFCNLCSGSDGNSTFISAEDTRILIDVGVSCKKITESLENIDEALKNVDAIFITHEHIDHIKGIEIINKKYEIPIYANEKTWTQIGIKFRLEKLKNKMIFLTGESVSIGKLEVIPFSIPHDAVEPVGYSILYNNKKISMITDIGHVNEALINRLDQSELIYLESNHDEEMVKVSKYPWSLKQRILGENGHLSNENAGKTILRLFNLGTKRFILGHLSKENNFPELAFETINNVLAENGIHSSNDIELEISKRNTIGKIHTI